MPVATGVVGDAGVGAILAALDMTAERRGAARFDRRHDAKLPGADMPGIGFAPRLAVAAEDIRHLQLWSRHRVQIRPAPRLPCSSVRAGSGLVGLYSAQPA